MDLFTKEYFPKKEEKEKHSGRGSCCNVHSLLKIGPPNQEM